MEELRDLNDSVDVKSLKNSIQQIEKDPVQYALNVIETNFVSNIKKFISAYKLGDSFAKFPELLGINKNFYKAHFIYLLFCK